jgi:transcriptional regulator with XRE-family HTH domain
MTKPPGPTLGHQIRTLRESMGWTQSELAAHVEQQVQAELEELGLSQLADQFRYEETAISQWEHDRSLPTTSELIALAKVLGCRAVIVGDEISLVKLVSADRMEAAERNGHGSSKGRL